MGIKDEIAFLSCTSKSLGTYNDAIDDVLSILDEWECVEKTETKSDTGFLHITISDYEAGDHISIYRRKKK